MTTPFVKLLRPRTWKLSITGLSFDQYYPHPIHLLFLWALLWKSPRTWSFLLSCLTAISSSHHHISPALYKKPCSFPLPWPLLANSLIFFFFCLSSNLFQSLTLICSHVSRLRAIPHTHQAHCFLGASVFTVFPDLELVCVVHADILVSKIVSRMQKELSKHMLSKWSTYCINWVWKCNWWPFFYLFIQKIIWELPCVRYWK